MLPIRTQAQCTDYLEHQRSTDHHLKQHLILLSHRGLTASVVVDLTVLLVWECQMNNYQIILLVAGDLLQTESELSHRLAIDK